MGKIIGIDLGTTNSAVAVFENGTAKLIPTANGDYLTPSIVAFKPSQDTHFVGEEVSQEAVEPEYTITSIKRFMGRKFKDTKDIGEQLKELRKAVELATYELTPAENGDIWVRIADRDYSPPEISAMILRKLKQDAENYLGDVVRQAVISVPAYFNDAQRKATIAAGKIAGLDVLRIINEPTAASLAYGIDGDRDGTIAVYDLGGGTFDITILNLENGVFKVRATDGEAFLGGDDFDAPVVDWLSMRIENTHGIDVLKDTTARSRLLKEAKQARHKLSSVEKVVIDLPNIAMGKDGPINFNTTISRSQLMDLVEVQNGPIERSLARCGEVLDAARLTPKNIDTVLLVGGMTKMPAVRSAVQGYFGQEPKTDINPDEAVALGAAINAGLMEGNVTDIAVINVTPLSYGTSVKGGIMDVIIPRNTPIPTKKSERYTTVVDDQTSVEFGVYQGERPMAEDNIHLDSFKLDQIPPAPRGEPSFEVTFQVDANGILDVRARDRDTGREKQIRIDANSGLSDEQVAHAKAEAERYAQEDAMRKEKAEAINAADIKVYHAKRLLRDQRQKLEKVDISELQFRIESTENVCASGNVTDIIKASEDLAQCTREISKKIHRK